MKQLTNCTFILHPIINEALILLYTEQINKYDKRRTRKFWNVKFHMNRYVKYIGSIRVI